MLIRNNLKDKLINIYSNKYSRGILDYDVENDNYRFSIIEKNGDRQHKILTTEQAENFEQEIDKIISLFQ